MSGVLLKAYGKKFDIDSFLKTSKLKPIDKYYRGDLPSSKVLYKKDILEESGFVISLSSKEKNYKGQMDDVKRFFKKNKNELKRLQKFKGIDQIFIDFSIWHGPDFGAHFTFFDKEFITHVYTIGLEIQVSCWNNSI